MGAGGGTRTEYVQAPTPVSAPAQTQAEREYLLEQKRQMEEMQRAYKANLDALNAQYAESQKQSSTVLQQLQASYQAQQKTADANRLDLQAANEASGKQLQLLAASRDQATGQLTEARNQQTDQAGSMMDRLTRRRAARKIRY